MGYPAIEIRQSEYPGATFVPNDFIDRYMAKAPGEYVKVYLYLLRCLNDKEASFSFAGTAALFDSSEADIRRALFYWEDTGLLSLDCSGTLITGIALCPAGTLSPAASRGTGTDPAALRLPEYNTARLHAFASEPDMTQVIFVAEQYLGHRLSRTELCCFCCWSQELGFAPDLIIDLTDHCVSEGCTDIAQLHARALEWHAADVRTSEDVRRLKQEARRMASEAGRSTGLQEKVCSAFGISGRVLNDAECARIAGWVDEWAFSDEMICEACRRTVANTHQASFEYAETILRNWYRAHITNPEDVRADDEAFRARRNASQHTSACSAASSGNSSASSSRSSSARRSRYGELELLTMAST